MMRKIKICVLHGAISNGGDFLIFERGKKLLEEFLNDNFELIYKKRNEQICGKYDGLIILGGPLITRKIHKQSKNIYKYIKEIKKDIPIFCIGLGISGKRVDSYKNYFLDEESINFWKYVYKSSKTFSVRDKITQSVLEEYNIKTTLTGCPALFNLNILKEGKKETIENNKKITKIAITIPNISLPPIFSSLSSFLLTLYFIILMRKEFNEKDLGLFFQHHINSFSMKIIQKLASAFGIKTYDISGKSLEFTPELDKYDVHIGTRLHSHIYFLSSGKPSFLLNVDNRTEAFLKTIKTPNQRYTFFGIKHLINLLKERIDKQNFNEFNNIPNEIDSYYKIMRTFLNKIKLYYRGEEK